MDVNELSHHGILGQKWGSVTVLLIHLAAVIIALQRKKLYAGNEGMETASTINAISMKY